MTDNQTPKKLKPKQAKTLTYYFDLGDVQAACDKAGIVKSTFYRWTAEDEAFKAALRQAESQALAIISGQLTALASRAGAELLRVLDDPDSSSHQRLRAVEIILTNLLKLRELVTLEERVAALERGSSDKP